MKADREPWMGGPRFISAIHFRGSNAFQTEFPISLGKDRGVPVLGPQGPCVGGQAERTTFQFDAQLQSGRKIRCLAFLAILHRGDQVTGISEDRFRQCIGSLRVELGVVHRFKLLPGLNGQSPHPIRRLGGPMTPSPFQTLPASSILLSSEGQA